jgi:hypothetical protein
VVERTDTPVRPSRGSRTARKVRPTSPPSSRPSQGFPASRSSSPRVVAVHRFTAPSPPPEGGLEVFRRATNPGAIRDRLPQAWAPSQGAIHTAGRRPWPSAPLLGFLAPPATWATGSARPGLTSPGTFRPRRFSRPRRFAPPPLCERVIDRCHSWGSLVPRPFRAPGPWRVSAPQPVA